MTVSNTPNLQLPYPDGDELVSGGPNDFQNIVQVLDGGTNGPTAMRVLAGTLVLRPPASAEPFGTVYHATDVPAVFLRDENASWRYIPLDGQSVPLGSVQAFAGSSDPTDPDGTTRWMVCDGRAISRTTFVSAFGVMGTTYGTGDGSSTFNIPSLQQKFPLGKAAGGTGSTLGSTGGVISHTHPVPGLSVPGLSVPGLNVPSLSVPGLSVPGLSVPGLSVPSLSASVTVPNLSLFATVTPAFEFQQFTGGSIGFSAAAYPGGGFWSVNGVALSAAASGSTGTGTTGTGTTGTGTTGTGSTGGGTTGTGTTGTGTTGTGTSGTNDPPYLVVNYIIKVL